MFLKADLRKIQLETVFKSNKKLYMVSITVMCRSVGAKTYGCVLPFGDFFTVMKHLQTR